MHPLRRIELSKILTHHAAISPHSIALAAADQRFDFARLNRRTNRAANALVRAGIRVGDRVALRLPSSHRHFECLFACAKLAAVMVPLDAGATSGEVEYFARDSAAALLFDSEDAYDSFIAGMPETEPGERAKSDDPLLIMYTSGTTGHSKGVVLTHENIFFTSFNQLIGWRLTATDRVLVVDPLHHAGGLLALGLPCLFAGGTIHLSPPRPDAIVETIERERITALFLPPRLWNRLASDAALDKAGLTSVRLCASGGDPIPLRILKPLIERFQAEFTDAYGLSEAASCSTLLQGTDVVRRHGSAGKALAFNRIRVVNPDGSAAAADEIGQIVQAGPTIMREYWRRPAETEAALRQGWLWTGDLGRIDTDGFLYVLGRSVDVVTSSGVKIYPCEVENVLREHPAVEEAAIIGIADARTGEATVACVAPRTGMTLTSVDVLAFCAGRMAVDKEPKEVFVCSALPRNANGKVIKAKLREAYGNLAVAPMRGL
jgi:fatty-acyl-CoA synthase